MAQVTNNTLIREFFKKAGTPLELKELKALTPKDRQELADLAAAEMGEVQASK